MTEIGERSPRMNSQCLVLILTLDVFSILMDSELKQEIQMDCSLVESWTA
jgi:hypothetical protein